MKKNKINNKEEKHKYMYTFEYIPYSEGIKFRFAELPEQFPSKIKTLYFYAVKTDLETAKEALEFVENAMKKYENVKISHWKPETDIHKTYSFEFEDAHSFMSDLNAIIWILAAYVVAKIVKHERLDYSELKKLIEKHHEYDYKKYASRMFRSIIIKNDEEHIKESEKLALDFYNNVISCPQ